MGVTVLDWEKTTIYFSKQLSFHRKPLPSSESACAVARANHAKNDPQKGCAMQLNGITLKDLNTQKFLSKCVLVGLQLNLTQLNPTLTFQFYLVGNWYSY